MKIILATITAFFLVSCDNGAPLPITTSTSDEFKVRVIDGCEYLEYDQGIVNNRVYSLTHKGDCKNPVHQHGR